ncbi:MAG: HPr family phosphocarrier protein [Erysipelotrichaceae bacterium]|nr:HPr family phosphocarrier protein [Erysipelotrichaceae bacterium]
MKEETVKIINKTGLHARPATIAVSAANRFACEVFLTYEGRTVNMKSIMSVMSLLAPADAELKIGCDGDDEEEALEGILEVLRKQEIIA